jgi:hypothetical protein
MNQSKEIQGFFVPFENEELEDVKKTLDLLGYTPDGMGMKDLLLDALYGDMDDEKESDTERFIKKSREYLKTHPETVNMGISALKSLANMFGKSRRSTTTGTRPVA